MAGGRGRGDGQGLAVRLRRVHVSGIRCVPGLASPGPGVLVYTMGMIMGF